MNNNAEEIEVKFYLSDPVRFTQHLMAAGAVLISGRIYEKDLRFDDLDGSLGIADQVLRLRIDRKVTLTFKSSGVLKAGASVRQEYEVGVSDFEMTLKLLEALGYHPCLVYEKYRTTYGLQDCEVVLDEMPYGWFCEIEGKSPKMIKQVATGLGLRWEARIVESYITLFQKYKQKSNMNFNDLTFANFTNIVPAAIDLDVDPGDTQSSPVRKTD